MKGYRTIITMGMGMLFSILQFNGVVVPESEQAAISTGIVSLLGIVLRFMTSGPVGKKNEA